MGNWIMVQWKFEKWSSRLEQYMHFIFRTGNTEQNLSIWYKLQSFDIQHRNGRHNAVQTIRWLTTFDDKQAYSFVKYRQQ